MENDPVPGFVSLVGAGPGDPELLTLKALRRLQAAECILHDRLVGRDILALCAPGAELVYVGKQRERHALRQEQINRLLVERARAGLRVVRLKGGDPFIFGRGGEEVAALIEARIPFDVIPGITAASGCAAAAGIPLTHRDHASMLVLATGHLKDGEPDLDWQALCRPRQTLVFYMGHKALDLLLDRLVEHGLPAETPAALIENGTLPGQRTVRATLGTLAAMVGAAGFTGPALLIVGGVAALGG